jgi:hypothetical protein
MELAIGKPGLASAREMMRMQPPARESTLTWKANEFTDDVKARGSALLSALEKKLRQGQEIALLRAVRAVKQKQINEQTRSLPASKKTKI